jgi:hypothetical protein
MPRGFVAIMPKFAVMLASLASLAWLAAPIYSPPRTLLQANGPPAAILLIIPVALSLLGLFSDRLRRGAGAALLAFSLAVCLVSVWTIGLSYLPSSVLLLIGPRKKPAGKPRERELFRMLD